MKLKHLPILLLLAALLSAPGCGGGDDGPSDPPPPAEKEPCEVPVATGLRVSLNPEKTTLAAGEEFWVAVVLHNVQSAFGASVEVTYPHAKVRVDRLQTCSGYFTGSVVQVSQIEPALDRVSYGVSYLRGGGNTENASGVLCYLECTALEAGNAALNVPSATVRLLKEDGTAIPNIGALLIDPVTLVIQ